ncbi:MAG: hypothetical protein ABIQ95_12930 [Bdellovibrionia bacterium]
MEAHKILQRYFVENRSRLIDIAAYLDRIGRSNDFDQVKEDFRWIAFKKSLQVLLSEEQNKVEKIQEILSDPTQEPLESAKNSNGQSASGAFGDQNKSDCC